VRLLAGKESYNKKERLLSPTLKGKLFCREEGEGATIHREKGALINKRGGERVRPLMRKEEACVPSLSCLKKGRAREEPSGVPMQKEHILSEVPATLLAGKRDTHPLEGGGSSLKNG